MRHRLRAKTPQEGVKRKMMNWGNKTPRVVCEYTTRVIHVLGQTSFHSVGTEADLSLDLILPQELISHVDHSMDGSNIGR